MTALPTMTAVPLDQLTLPKGFHIAVYSDQVPNAREIAIGMASNELNNLPVSDDLDGALYRVTYQP